MRSWLDVLSVIMFALVCVPYVNAGMIQDGLVANWSFDQATVAGTTVRDLAGSYDATMNGGPKIVPGRYGEAIQFDGKDDYLDLTALPGIGPQLAAYSMEFWLKTELTDDWTTFFKTLTDGLAMGWGIDLNRTAAPAWAYSAGNTHFYLRDSTGVALAPEIQAEIYDNTWHHIAWIVDDSAANLCRIYVDGEEQVIAYAYENSPSAFIDFQHPVYLGAANNRAAIERFCPVTVDELRIYARALTSQEVQQNLGSGAAVNDRGKLPLVWAELKDNGFH